VSERDVQVCHIITRLDLGGAQENTLYTVANLRRPFRASLVCGPGGLLDEDARGLRDVPVHFESSLVRPIRPMRDLLAVARLARLLRRSRPQIVHTHSSKAGIVGRVAARLAGVPIVVHTIHGFGFNSEQSRAVRACLVAAERAVAPLTSHFITVSRANLEEGIARGVVPADRVSLIRSGIPMASFGAGADGPGSGRREDVRSAIGLPPHGPLVGMVACLKPQKSPLDFVEVAARVARIMPEARFVIAGDGELREAVSARAESLGLSARFHLLGWRRDIPRLLTGLDVMVLTSSWEGLPRVLPEAIAAGVPIVATAVDGTNDIIVEGRTGLVRRPHDLKGLSEAVVRLLRDPALGHSLAARARDVLPEFDIDLMVRAQESLYQTLLERRFRTAAGGMLSGGAGLESPGPTSYIDEGRASGGRSVSP
jgi:glycosyltransferase involved in cell wall biosynthesis